MTLLWVALGGALGAVLRYLAMSATQQKLAYSAWAAPLSTLLVNVFGSFLLGALYVVLHDKIGLESQWRHLLSVGFLGAFTTFSTFSLDAVHLLEAGHYLNAAGYITASVGLCIVACWLAMQVVRIL